MVARLLVAPISVAGAAPDALFTTTREASKDGELGGYASISYEYQFDVDGRTSTQ